MCFWYYRTCCKKLWFKCMDLDPTLVSHVLLALTLKGPREVSLPKLPRKCYTRESSTLVSVEMDYITRSIAGGP